MPRGHRHGQDGGLHPAHAPARHDADAPRAPRGLILVPTREPLRVARAVHDYGKKLGIRVVPLGGADCRPRNKA